jgi:hypothetical protein
LIFGSIIGFEEVRELSFQHTASKAHPFKIRGYTVCSSSQVEYKGERFTLTNRHCCQALSRKNKSKKERQASFTRFDLVGQYAQIDDTLQEILSLDKKHDLCILTPDLTKASLKVAKSFRINEPVHVIGHPRGMPQTIRAGRIVSVESHIFPWVNKRHKLDSFLISNIGYGGNSGSPVVDRFGQLVAVVFAGSHVYHTEMLAVPLAAVREFLDREIGE